MILVDTNIIIDARHRTSPFHRWAEGLIAEALSAGGIAVNAIVLAELCVGQDDPSAVEVELRAKGYQPAFLPIDNFSENSRAFHSS